MKLEINPRGNGACPLCARLRDCRIRARLSESLSGLPDEEGKGLEIAVFACPSFVEKDHP